MNGKRANIIVICLNFSTYAITLNLKAVTSDDNQWIFTDWIYEELLRWQNFYIVFQRMATLIAILPLLYVLSGIQNIQNVLKMSFVHE